MEKLPIKLDVDDSFFKEEVLCDYTVTEDMKKVWAIELDLYNELKNFCEAKNIPYFAISGTLLGAARHQGFIPWDDDMDIAVPRKAFNRFCKLAAEHFKEPYFFQTEETDYGFLHVFARLRNSETTAIPYYDADSKLKHNQGIWIDIFPLDSIPDGKAERKEWIKKVNKYHKQIWMIGRLTTRYKTPMNNENAIKKMRYISGPFLKWLFETLRIPNIPYREHERIVQKYKNVKTEEIK